MVVSQIISTYMKKEKQILGRRLYPLINTVVQGNPALARKVTGMMLENDYEQLRSVIDDHDQLVTVVTGAVNALLRFGGEFYVMEKEATANTAGQVLYWFFLLPY